MFLDYLNAAVRPLVTLMLTAALTYGFVVKLVNAEAFLSIVGVVITFWFTQRQAAKDSMPPAAPPTT